MRIIPAQILLLTGMLILLPACSSTRIQSTRHPTGAAVGPFRNVIVVGIDQRPEVRNPFENAVADLMQKRGVEATASHTRFTLKEMQGDREQIRQRLLAAKAESALFVRVSGRTDFLSGSPPSLGSPDMAALDDARYNAFTTPGGEIKTDVGLGIRFYRVSDGLVIWSGIMDTILKEDYDSIAVLRKVAKTIVDQLAKDKVIP